MKLPVARFLDSPLAVRVGACGVAIPMMAFGVQHLVLGQFVTRLIPGLPEGPPAPTVIARAVGGVLVLAGALLAAGGRWGRATGIGLGVTLLVSFATLHAPRVASAPANIGYWVEALKCAALAAGALAVAGTTARRSAAVADLTRGSGVLDRALVWTACGLLAVYLVYCGYVHFIIAPFVAQLVPRWIPGALGWAYVAGAALALGGLGTVVPPVHRLAAGLTSAMIFSWVWLLHLPRAVTMRDANETTALFEALAFASTALLLATVPARAAADGRTESPTHAH